MAKTKKNVKQLADKSLVKDIEAEMRAITKDIENLEVNAGVKKNIGQKEIISVDFQGKYVVVVDVDRTTYKITREEYNSL